MECWMLQGLIVVSPGRGRQPGPSVRQRQVDIYMFVYFRGPNFTAVPDAVTINMLPFFPITS